MFCSEITFTPPQKNRPDIFLEDVDVDGEIVEPLSLLRHLAVSLREHAQWSIKTESKLGFIILFYCIIIHRKLPSQGSLYAHMCVGKTKRYSSGIC